MRNVNLDLNHFVTEAFPRNVYVDERCKYGNYQPFLHWHPHYEIHIVLTGDYTVISNNQTIHSTEPGIYLHAPYSLHSGSASPDALYHCFVVAVDRKVPHLFTAETMDMSIFNQANFICATPTASELEELKNIIVQIQQHNDDPTTCALYAALILHNITKIIADDRGKCFQSSFTYMQDLLSHIGDNLSEPQTIAELAAKYGVSESKLRMDFKATVGTTYKKYLTDLRQTHARTLLENGTSIINTSLECGYSSEAHFVKAFREYWDVTPGEFIRRKT